MHLYSLTLQKASGITAAVFGNFSAPKQQELIVARGKILELMRPDDNGKVQTVHSSEVFGIIRSIATFRLTGPPWQQQPPTTHARRPLIALHKCRSQVAAATTSSWALTRVRSSSWSTLPIRAASRRSTPRSTARPAAAASCPASLWRPTRAAAP